MIAINIQRAKYAMSSWQELDQPRRFFNSELWFVRVQYSTDCLLNNSCGTAPVSSIIEEQFCFGSELDAYMHLSNYYSQHHKLNPYLAEWEDAVIRAGEVVITARQRRPPEQEVMDFA